MSMTFEYKKSKQITIKQIQDYLNGDDPLKDAFEIENILYILPQGYESPVPFEIVHVREETRSIYFMSKDILAIMRIAKVDMWLEDFKSKLPPELMDCLKPIERINANGTYSRLIAIPSIKNMCRDSMKRCKGSDDIEFDKFKTEVGRCKNFKGEIRCYWTDTPDMVGIRQEAYDVVKSNGDIDSAGYWHELGVCPIFKLSKD